VAARQIHAVDVSSAAQTALHAANFLPTEIKDFFINTMSEFAISAFS
jgi:hypothetical protein